MTDDDVVSQPDFLDRAQSVLEAGGRDCAIQLRAHGLPGGRFFDLATRLLRLASGSGGGLWINDRVDVASALRADGVQLGRLSLPLESARRVLGRSCPIGCSAHAERESDRLLREGADLVVLGNIFATASHPDRRPLGLDVLRRAASSGRPIVAIGGISVERIAGVIEAGAWGVAALSGVWATTDPGAAARRYVRALERARRIESPDIR